MEKFEHIHEFELKVVIVVEIADAMDRVAVLVIVVAVLAAFVAVVMVEDAGIDEDENDCSEVEAIPSVCSTDTVIDLDSIVLH